MQLSDPPAVPIAPPRQFGWKDAVMGTLGALVIHGTLLGVRFWAWITRTDYLDD